MSPLWIAVLFTIVALLAEALHVRRILRAGRMIFASVVSPRLALAVTCVAIAAALAIGMFAWGAATLYVIAPRSVSAQDLPDAKVDPDTLRHIVILLDVSPSMTIRDVDAGRQSRASRAADVAMEALSQVDLQHARCSVVAFFTSAKPVVIDTVDPNVIRNMVSGIPLTGAFEDGKTDLIAGLKGAFDLAAEWKPGSTSVLMISDGDTVSLEGMPKPPASVSHIRIIGVGDTQRGTFIDGHLSRQDAGSLRQIANRLSGSYFNATSAYLPPDTLEGFAGVIPADKGPGDASLREYALWAIALSAAVFLLLPFLQSVIDQSRGGSLNQLSERRHPRASVAD